MMIAFFAVGAGLILLVWSASRFVDGASSAARRFGMPPLLIGMIIVGFGTSAPELVVSAFSALQNNPGLALGNAYGSNITNIALILGVTALISPIKVQSQVLRQELPVLIAVTLLAVYQLWDGEFTRVEAFVLLGVFAGLLFWSVHQGLDKKDDNFGSEVKQELDQRTLPYGRALFWLGTGLVLLIISSRLLVWGAVEIAHGFGVSDLIIGLTVVAAGTSLPELASSVIAAKKGENDIALGNVLGSNLFNTLAVTGIAGTIQPMQVAREVLFRDMLVMSALTLCLFLFCYGFRRPGQINRYEGAALLVSYIGYVGFLVARHSG